MKENKALALAAGGARGAYQAGALRALAEDHKKYHTVSGTSVGVLNAAFYLQSDGSVKAMEELCLIWEAIGKIGLVELKQNYLDEFFSLRIFKPGGHILNPEPLQKLLDAHLDYKKICRVDGEFFITTIPSIDPLTDILLGSFQVPRYYRARDLTPALLRSAILAAIAIPVAFPSISIDGRLFTDAGLSIPLPSKILYDLGHMDITSIFLSDTIIQNRLDYPGASVLQIRPSINISPNLMSMLDFSPLTIQTLLDLGYNDAGLYLAEVDRMSDRLNRLKKNKEDLDDLMNKLPIT